MVRGRLALLIAYGPEARAFLQSGLAARLSVDWDLAIVAAEPGSAAFARRSEPVLEMPPPGEERAMERIRGWGRGLRRRAPRLRGASIHAERMAGRFWGGGCWKRFLEDHGIAAVVAASASGPRMLPALQAASNLGLPAVVLFNSWKDLYVRGEIPAPLPAAGAVTPQDLRRLEVAPGRPRVRELCGSLHQAAVRQAQPMSRESLCAVLGLDPGRPIVLYATAANDPEEAPRLAWLADRLGDMLERPQLLIRPNPMDHSERLYAAIAARPDVALLMPAWEWRPEREWNCPLPEDLPWWRAALEHSAMGVGLPSSVSLDLAAWGKPTVHVAWGRGAALWLDESQESLRRTAGVVPAWTPGEAAAQVQRLLLDPPAMEAPRADSAAAAARLITQTCLEAGETRRAWTRPKVALP